MSSLIGVIYEAPKRDETVGPLPELGITIVRPPTGAVERVLQPFYADDDAFAAEFVDVLASHTVASPALSYDDVAGLPEPTRAALRDLLVQASQLTPRAGRSDQDLLVGMRERHSRLASQVRETERSLTALLRSLAQEAQARAHAQARGGDIRAVVEGWAQALQQTADAGKRALAYFDQHPLGFIVEGMLFAGSMELLIESHKQGDQVMEQALLEAIDIEPDFLSEVESGIRNASSLDADQKDELLGGLEMLRAKRYPSACRLLIGGAEGTLWAGALVEGVIDDQRHLLSTARPEVKNPGRLAKSPNNLLDEKHGLDLRGSYRLFLSATLWDNTGHNLRHGRTRARQRAYALWSLVALCGWLDRVERSRLMYLLGDRLDEVTGNTSSAPVDVPAASES